MATTPEEKRERKNAYRRGRYANDTEYRERCKEKSQKWRERPGNGERRKEYILKYKAIPENKKRLSEYNRKRREKPGYKEYQREYISKWYRDPKTTIVQNKRYVEKIRRAANCTDCGYNKDWRILQFDHVRGEKVADVCKLLNKSISLEKIKDEIAKCEIVCPNCHWIRTFDRKGFVGLLENDET